MKTNHRESKDTKSTFAGSKVRSDTRIHKNVLPATIDKSEAVRIINRIKSGNMNIRKDIFDIYTYGAYKAFDYSSFAELINKILSRYVSRSAIYRHLSLAKVEMRIEPKQNVGSIVEIRLRQLNDYTEDDQIDIWNLSKSIAKRKKRKTPISSDIKTAARKLHKKEKPKSTKKKDKGPARKPVNELFKDISKDYTINEQKELFKLLKHNFKQASNL